MPATKSPAAIVRQTQRVDIPQIIELSARVYGSPAWSADQLHSHLSIFPQGQLVATTTPLPRSGAPRAEREDRIIGMAASLIVDWEDYTFNTSWRTFTNDGWFTNHDPHGRTLYGAEVMVDPESQGRGVGKKLYSARRELCRSLGLARIRAGARLPGYRGYADRMSAEDYVLKVIRGELGDPTLSFQLKRGFRVIAVVPGYLPGDVESGGYAAVIEWVNHAVAQPREYRRRDRKFGKPRLRHPL